MNKFKLITFSCFLLTLVLLFTSCKKDGPEDNDTVATQDHSTADAESGKAFEAVDRVIRGTTDKTGEDSENRFLPECASVTIDSLSSPRKVLIDFGTTGCVCDNWDNRTRKGKIIATYTGRYRDPGTVITWTTEDYFVDNKEHRINKTVENKGKNSSGKTYFHIIVSNTVVTSEGTVSWSAKRQREWTSGEETRLIASDDRYTITDLQPTIGKSRKGADFTVNITQPLIWNVGCRFKLVSGETQLSINGKEKRTINYGNGNCDRSFTVTIKGRTYVVAW